MARISGRDMIKKAIKDYGGSGVGFFSLKDDGDKAKVRFLHTDDTDLEIFVVHKVEVDGKDVYVECLQDTSCPLCAAGNKASLKEFFALYDYKEDKILIWDRGPGIIDSILGLIDKYGHLNNRDYEVQRHGKANDTKTSYQLFPEDKGPMVGPDGKEMPVPERPPILGRYVKQWSAEEMETNLASGDTQVASRRDRAKNAANKKGPGF